MGVKPFPIGNAVAELPIESVAAKQLPKKSAAKDRGAKEKKKGSL